jgi:hypothetical protein
MFQLTYTLGEHGWADASFGDGVAQFDVRVSYVGDALLGFARGVRGILRGMAQTSFRFAEEPGSHVFVLTRIAAETGGREDVRVDVYTSDGMFEAKVRERLLTTTCGGLRALATTCINCLRRTLDEHGEAEYLRRWRRPFPTAEYRELLEMRRAL